MKLSETDIVIVPGFGNSGPEHWQSRWQARMPTARRIAVPDWERADRASWVEAVVTAVDGAGRPVVLVAHSIGAATVAHAAPRLAGRVSGAFLVAPSDWDRPEVLPGVRHDFAPIPMAPLPFPSVLVASSDDPYCEIQRAADFAEAWGADFVDAGASGHINAESGHGPWPEGLMRFAGFLARLGQPA